MSALVSCFGNDENGNSTLILSKRDRCENTVRETQNGFDPTTCIVTLAVETRAMSLTYVTDATLLWCLVYQFEMAKGI